MPGLIRSEIDHGHRFELIYDDESDTVTARCEACGEPNKMRVVQHPTAQAGEFPQSYQGTR